MVQVQVPQPFKTHLGDSMETVKNVYVKQKIVAQDIEFGLGKLIQVRSGQRVEGKQINAEDIPFDTDRSVKDVLTQLLSNAGLS